MNIVFRDELGYISVQLDDFGVSFNGSYAKFSTIEGHEYKIPVKDVIYIGKEC